MLKAQCLDPRQKRSVITRFPKSLGDTQFPKPSFRHVLAASKIGMQQSELKLTRAVCLEAINLAEAKNGLKWAKLRLERSTEGWQITQLRVKAGLSAQNAGIIPKLEIARSEEWLAGAQGAANQSANCTIETRAPHG